MGALRAGRRDDKGRVVVEMFGSSGTWDPVYKGDDEDDAADDVLRLLGAPQGEDAFQRDGELLRTAALALCPEAVGGCGGEAMVGLLDRAGVPHGLYWEWGFKGDSEERLQVTEGDRPEDGFLVGVEERGSFRTEARFAAEAAARGYLMARTLASATTSVTPYKPHVPDAWRARMRTAVAELRDVCTHRGQGDRAGALLSIAARLLVVLPMGSDLDQAGLVDGLRQAGIDGLGRWSMWADGGQFLFGRNGQWVGASSSEGVAATLLRQRVLSEAVVEVDGAGARIGPSFRDAVLARVAHTAALVERPTPEW
jgi:hypothetical protein